MELEVFEKIEKLKTLQDILAEKINLEQEIQEIPKLLVTQKELLTRMKKSFIEKNQEYEKSKAAEVEYRNSLADAESKIEKAERNMELISTQREYEALDKEREDAEDKAKDFRTKLLREERILLDLDERIKQDQALIEQQEKELEDGRRNIEEEVSSKKAQMAVLSEQEQSLAPDLDPEVLFKFDRTIRKKMRGIVAIKGGVCMGCHMILPAQFANTVRQGQEIVFCPYCSRILFYEESEQGEEDFFHDEDSGSLSDLEDMEDDEYEDEEEEEDDKPHNDYDE
ncbi:MAG: C4-type zinc ribbon domain-containing protein [Treponema sp.]|nr:C4-type zinc ribbon domain-containing protein [Treponema sp.]